MSTENVTPPLSMSSVQSRSSKTLDGILSSSQIYTQRTPVLVFPVAAVNRQKTACHPTVSKVAVGLSAEVLLKLTAVAQLHKRVEIVESNTQALYPVSGPNCTTTDAPVNFATRCGPMAGTGLKL